ncbi:hypothetical protein ACFW2D_28660 [Streptomyces sp. NPDC058914]|uniref:hypothetical protein n=1 Tax=Streptomyces sp. NPDC058914 TaxID=3346671 RepID=UPI0036A5DF5C
MSRRPLIFLERHTAGDDDDAQRLLDLAAAAPASRDEDLVLLLRAASELYQQGFADLRETVAARFAGLSGGDLMAAATAAGMPCDVSQDREELVLLMVPLQEAHFTALAPRPHAARSARGGGRGARGAPSHRRHRGGTAGEQCQVHGTSACCARLRQYTVCDRAWAQAPRRT